MDLTEALSLHRRGNLRGAEEAYRRLMARDPGCHEALQGLGLVMHQRGRDDLAVSMITQALDLCPERSDYHYHLAEILRATGRAGEAIDAYRAAIERADNRADYFSGLASALMEQGSNTDAIRAYCRALQLAPDDAEIHNDLGNALADAGDADAAVEHLRRAVALVSGYADAHHNLAVALKASGDVDQATVHARRACELAPGRAEPLVCLGQLLERSGSRSGAIECYREAEKRGGDNAVLLVTIADCLRRADAPRDAVDIYRTAIEMEPNVAAYRVGLSRCLIQLHRFTEAEAEGRKAREIAPDHAPALGTLAVCLQARGRFDKAAWLLHRALELNPRLGEAAYLLATDGTYEVSDGELEHWRNRAGDSELSSERRFHFHFAVARVDERRGNDDSAFGHFREANRIKGDLYPFDAGGHSEYVKRIMSVFTREFFAERAGYGVDDERPVFIVGMPRSGSTLVEQILSSHPGVVALGEHPEMRELVRELPEVVDAGEPVPECCGELSAAMSRWIARRYLRSVPQSAVNGAPRISDKMLGNFLRLGVIALLFPNARVVHCVRDPLDTCVSCFTQNFNQGLRFTTDLSHLASFYRDYYDLMAHWRRVLPLPIMDVSYESLVREPERVSRSLIDFCGLAWDERCLTPQRTEREIGTASAWQARQPVYTASVGRWRRYERHIGPLIQGLRDAGIADVA